MFRRQREFNIISGEQTQFTSNRSHSCAEQRHNFDKIQTRPFKLERLGNARDRKEFQYSYAHSHQDSQPTMPVASQGQTKLPTMVNYVSTNYNIINHRGQIETSSIIQKSPKQTTGFEQHRNVANRKSPLTGIIHAGRLLAPNYHEDYAQKQSQGEFIRKKGLCQQMCSMQKGYSIGKLFRTMK